MKWLLVGFYDKINVSLRVLSSVLKEEGQEVDCVFLKSDRSSVIKGFRPDNKYYQYLFNGKYVGCGEDVNPVTDHEMDLLVEKTKEIQPHVVAMSCRSALLGLSGRVLGRLSKALPDAIYVAGGYGPTVEPEKFSRMFDYVCVGEGEPFIRGLVKRLGDVEDWEVAVPNGVGEYKVDVPKIIAPPEDLDRYWPDWEFEGKWLIEDDKVTPIEQALDTGVYDVFASKGCLSTCTYCQANQWLNFYKRYGATYPKMRLRMAEKVIDELSWAKRKFNLRYVRFMDSMFGWKREWLKNFLDMYKYHIGLPFFCYTDVRWMDEERFGWLLDAGMVKSVVGIQSADRGIRQGVMGRDITDGELLKYAWMVHDSGIDFQYDIIHWNPFDTLRTLEKGLAFIQKLPPARQIVVCELKMFPGSPITEMYEVQKPQEMEVSKVVQDFYAWLYVMTLMGEAYKQSAQYFWNLFQNKWVDEGIVVRMKKAFELIRKHDMRKIKLNCDVKKGTRLSTLMFDFVRSEVGDIEFDDRLKVQGTSVTRDLVKGAVLRWEDIFSSYGEKGAF